MTTSFSSKCSPAIPLLFHVPHQHGAQYDMVWDLIELEVLQSVLSLSELSWESSPVFGFRSAFELQLQCTIFSLCLLILTERVDIVPFFPQLMAKTVRYAGLDLVTGHITLQPHIKTWAKKLHLISSLVSDQINKLLWNYPGNGGSQHKETEVIWHVRTYKIPHFCDQ